MVATDDLVTGGNERHQVLMEELHQKYKLGKWEHDTGRFCGKDVRQDQNHSIFVSQQYYTELKCKDKIKIPNGSSDDDPCTADQVRELRKRLVP